MTDIKGNNFPVVSEGHIGNSLVQTVNARDLHTFLGVGKDFSNWIKDRISQYNFAENSDFAVFAGSGGNPSGGRPSIEYAISIDMAKEMAMVERNEKGKQVRQYFIECERQARAVTGSSSRPSAQIAVAREARLQYRMFRGMLKDLGIKGNQAVLSANRATVLTTGFDAMGALGITHAPAEVNEPDLSPSDIAKRLGLRTAQEVNKRLLQYGYQSAHRDHKARLYYELTPKGERAGGVFKDTGKRSGNGVPVKQLMWAAGICDRLRSDMSLEAA